MIETLLDLVPRYGLWIVAASTYVSCLGAPIPSSLIMLTAGAFVAAGDLPLDLTVGVAFIGAVAGDQTGFRLGRGGGVLMQRLGGGGGKTAELVARATALADRHGGWGVFLSRWLLSPLGPYMNFVGGAARMGWARFTAWGAAGEVVWVGLYVGLGHTFAGQIQAVADIAGNFSGALAAGAVTVGLGLWLRAALRADRRHRQGKD